MIKIPGKSKAFPWSVCALPTILRPNKKRAVAEKEEPST